MPGTSLKHIFILHTCNFLIWHQIFAILSMLGSILYKRKIDVTHDTSYKLQGSGNKSGENLTTVSFYNLFAFLF